MYALFQAIPRVMEATQLLMEAIVQSYMMLRIAAIEEAVCA